jgi:hypothetical protein
MLEERGFFDSCMNGNPIKIRADCLLYSRQNITHEADIVALWWTRHKSHLEDMTLFYLLLQSSGESELEQKDIRNWKMLRK